MTLHLSTEGIEIEVSDMPDELAELRAFVERRAKYCQEQCDEAREIGALDASYVWVHRCTELLKILSEIDRLIAARGK